MKQLFIILFSLSALGSSATAQNLSQTLACGYLTKASGAPFPGLSRPSIQLDQYRADVEVSMDGGGRISSRAEYRLNMVKRSRAGLTYRDASGDVSLMVRASGPSQLLVKGLRATCR